MLAVGSRTCMLRLEDWPSREVFQPCGSCLYLNCSSCSLCDSVCGKQLFLKVYRQQVLGTVCIFFDSFVQKRNPRAFLEDPLSLVSLSCVLPW